MASPGKYLNRGTLQPKHVWVNNDHKILTPQKESKLGCLAPNRVWGSQFQAWAWSCFTSATYLPCVGHGGSLGIVKFSQGWASLFPREISVSSFGSICMHVVSVPSLLLSLGSHPGWTGQDRALGGGSGAGGLGNHKLFWEIISDLESHPSYGSFGPCLDPHCSIWPCAVWM